MSSKSQGHSQLPPVPDSPVRSVEAGGCVLEVGRSAGMIVTGEAKLEGPDGSEPRRSAPQAAEEAVDRASGVTAKIEQGDALYKDLADGSLSLAQAHGMIDTLIALLGRLDREERYEEALRVARTLSKLLALARRWAALIKALLITRRAGKLLKRPEAVAWAEHELGTVRLIEGDLKGADRALSEARRLREQLGDRRGLAATNRNLEGLCKRLRRMVREKRLVPKRLLALASPMAAAILALLLTAAGVAGGMALGNGGGSPEPSEGTGGTNPGNGGGGGPSNGDGQPSYPLKVEIEGDAAGLVKISPVGLVCRTSCSADEVKSEASVELTAVYGDGVEFAGFSGDCRTSADSCNLTVKGPLSVTATFELVEYNLSVEINGKGSVTSTPEGIDCTAASTNTGRAEPGPQFRLVAEKGEGEGPEDPETKYKHAEEEKEKRETEQLHAEEAETELEHEEEANTKREHEEKTEEEATRKKDSGNDTHPNGSGGGRDGDPGSGSASCQAPFPVGSTVTLEADAAGGWELPGFVEPCVEVSEGRCEVTVDGETSVEVTFRTRVD